MRKIILVLIFIFSNMSVQTINTPDELLDMAKITSDYGQEIDEWKVTIIEKISAKKADKLISSFKENTQVQMKQTKMSKQYVIEDRTNDKDIIVIVKMIVPDNKNQLTSITAEITGNELDDISTKGYIKTRDLVTTTYFGDKATRFACLKTKSSDIIKGVVFFDTMIEKLNITQISTQTDTVLNSTHNKIIYGYIKEWENKVKLDKQPINIQIVLDSTENNKQRIIIGTPILINEY